MGATAPGRARVALLTNPMPHTMATGKVLLDEGVNLVGVLAAQDLRWGIPVPQYLRALRRSGYLRTAHKACGRLLYGAINRRRNSSFYASAFNELDIHRSLSRCRGPGRSLR